MNTLQDKVIIITGSSSGIGRALSQQLLDAGAKVAGWSRRETKLDHPNFLWCKADISYQIDVQEALDKTLAAFGERVDGLINNAGLGYREPVDEMSVEKWHEMFDVNVHGLLYVSRLVIPIMKKQGEGTIVNVASLAGKNAVPNMVGYAGTKWAVRGISSSMMLELRDFGIKVSCIFPGSTQTEFFENTGGMQANPHGMSADEVAASITYILHSSENFLPSEIDLRPLKPKG